MPKIVKFHSIYYRFVLFIVVLYLLGAHQIVGRGIQTVNIFDYAFRFHQRQLGYFLLLLILVGIGINFLCPWKFSVAVKVDEKHDVDKAIAEFRKVKGVTSVNKDGIMQLQ